MLPLLGTLLLGGCFSVVHFPDRARMECIDPPPPPCLPGSFSEITIDTSSTTGRSSHYLKIERVGGLSGADDEFGIGFIERDGSRGIATIRGRNGGPSLEEMIAIRLPDITRAVAEQSVTVQNIQGAVGGATLIAGSAPIYFAARSAGSVAGDYDLFAGNYEARIEATPWNTISSLLYWDAQPAIAPDGNAIYFASDRPGGFGGTDIYVSRRAADGTWSDPQNIGPAVNSSCDELSPWVSGNGRWLYFSSAGHATVGGYDLFRAPILGEQFGAAENLGRPINTPGDELFPSAPVGADPDTLLYYSSNQPGSQGFDIYVLHRLRRSGRPITNVASRTVTMNGIVIDPQGRPVPHAQVTIEQRDPPGPRIQIETTPEGNYQVQVEEGRTYEIVAGSQNTLYYQEEVRIPISDGRTSLTHTAIIPDTVTFRVNFPFNDASTPYPFTLDANGLPTNLRWDDMIDRAATFLQQFNNRQAYRFQINGHTDPVGSDAFNLDLGRRRAEFIRNELVRRGVSSQILSIGSEGENRPLPAREGEDQTLYHARLRRVELIRK